MKVLKYIGIGILAIVAIILVLGLIAPKKTKVERSVVINAPAGAVLEQIKSLKNMNTWSPWAENDPNMKVEYEGADGEVGSVSKWDGNKEVGKGSQTVTSITDNRVGLEVKFLEPMESQANAYFEVEPGEGGTKTTWGFEQENDYPWNAFCLFIDMDAMLGKDFEKGLNKLKVKVEDMATQAAPADAPAAPADSSAAHM